MTTCHFVITSAHFSTFESSIARTRDQTHNFAQLHDDLPSFLMESKYALHRALQLQLRALEALEEYEQNLIQVIRGTLLQVFSETGKFPS